MAEAVVGVVIEELTSIAFEKIKEELSLVKNAKSDVEKLERNLKAIHAVLKDAEKRILIGDQTENSVKLWVDNLKDVASEMDNVLDEWTTYFLKLQIQKESGEEGDENDHQLAMTNMLFDYKECLRSLFSCFCTKVNRLALPLRHEIAKKIKELNETLAEIASQKDQFGLNTTMSEEPQKFSKSTSFIDETEVEGRDVDKEILVGKLLVENNTQQDKGLQIIPIVGMGGLGKTTLAQIAYKDEKVKAHFDLRIWVCVSVPFEEIKVAKAIIEAVEGKSPDINELESLLQRVIKCIDGKRFLLVLDDVWTEKREKWNQLKEPLKSGSKGSRVIVTTRKEEVAKMMGATKHMITLEKLSEEHCWLVFKKLAFQERSEEECKELDEIGRLIANKSKGLPLAAKSLGGLMCYKKTKPQWENVLHSEIWGLQNVNIFTPFLLSYNDLPAREKRCFSYCSIFPKDHRIEREQLIRMWMAQKYLGSAENQEDEGIDCFENLGMRSFFQNFETDGTYCKIHDIMHDFAQFVTEDECISVQAEDVKNGIVKPSNRKARHLTIAVDSNSEFPTLDFTELNNRALQTLFIENFSSFVNSEIDWSILQHLTCLRSLTLSSFNFQELPTSIGGLIHMRYLDLRHNKVLEQLPESLCELVNLQSLNVYGCISLRKLPEGVGKLVNLRHLYVGSLNGLRGHPKGFGKLTSLRSLDTLIAAEDKAAYFDIVDWKKFSKFQLTRNATIWECKNLGSREEAAKVDLKTISRYVDRLFLSFGGYEDPDGIREADREILEGLVPRKELLHLVIMEYRATTLSPTWIPFLTNLREITLANCGYCEVLPSLGELPSLESITIDNMDILQNVGPEFLGITEELSSTKIFPRLKNLKFSRMYALEKWEGGVVKEAISVMPCLESLELSYCPELRLLPDFLETTTSLREVFVNWSRFLEESCLERTGSEWDKISHAPNISIGFNYCIRKDGIWIES